MGVAIAKRKVLYFESIFKDTTYTTSFSFNGQTHTIEKPYLIQQENVENIFMLFFHQKERVQNFPLLSLKF